MKTVSNPASNLIFMVSLLYLIAITLDDYISFDFLRRKTNVQCNVVRLTYLFNCIIEINRKLVDFFSNLLFC